MALKRVPNICFPVAIDIVSRRDVPEHLYDLWGRLSAAQAQGEELSESFVIGMYVKVMQSVGISYNKAQWIHVKTLEEFQDYLIKAKKCGRGIVSIGNKAHDMAIQHLGEDVWDLAGISFQKEIIHLTLGEDQLFKKLQQDNPDEFNCILLPEEK